MREVASIFKMHGLQAECQAMTSSIQENREAYGEARMVISNRLHVLLLTMSSGGLPIALLEHEEHSKIAGLYEDIGLKDLVMNSKELSKTLRNSKKLDELQCLAKERFRQEGAKLRTEINRIFR